MPTVKWKAIEGPQLRNRQRRSIPLTRDSAYTLIARFRGVSMHTDASAPPTPSHKKVMVFSRAFGQTLASSREYLPP